MARHPGWSYPARVAARVLTVAALFASSWTVSCGSQSGEERYRTIERRKPTVSTVEKRVALVIGNSEYEGDPLRNPSNDAELMGRVLKRVGFEVMLGVNRDQGEMKGLIEEFGTKIVSSKGVALFYFAGHGMQIGGENYLIPVRENIQNAFDVESRGVPAQEVLDEMESAGTRVNIVILDACRNNPFRLMTRGWKEEGLASMKAARGTLIAYATAPGGVAADGKGKYGLFTSKLAEFVTVPGLEIRDVFSRAREEVMSASHDRQVPWESVSLVGGRFYFVPPESAGVPSAEPADGSNMLFLYVPIGLVLVLALVGYQARHRIRRSWPAVSRGPTDPCRPVGAECEAGRNASADQGRVTGDFALISDRGLELRVFFTDRLKIGRTDDNEFSSPTISR